MQIFSELEGWVVEYPKLVDKIFAGEAGGGPGQNTEQKFSRSPVEVEGKPLRCQIDQRG